MNALQPNVGTGNCTTDSKVFGACQDVFLAKLDPTATQILYCTYLGDNGMDWFGGLAVDAQGNAYFAATGYPAAPFFGRQPTGTGHAFVRKLSPDGAALLYDKSLGANTQAGAIALDAAGNAYLTGTSFSASFPAVHAVQPQTVVSPIFLTRDGGVSWNPVHAPAPTVNMLAIAPGLSTTLYAAASVGLLKSIDGGASWTNLIPAATAATVVVLDPKTPSTVYAVYSTPAVGSLPSQSVLARSLDAGATWSILSGVPQGFLANGPPSITGLAIDPENSSILWIVTVDTIGNSIDKSLDGGVTWKTAYSPMVKPPPFPIGPTTVAVNPANGARVYSCCVGYPAAGAGGSLFSTNDGGATWTAGGVGQVRAFAIDPSNPSVLYAVGYLGLEQSSDGGVSWSAVNLPAPGSSNNVLVSAAGVVYGVNDNGTFFSSADHGNTWSVTTGPFGPGSTFWLSTQRRRVRYTSDRRRARFRMHSPPSWTARAIRFGPPCWEGPVPTRDKVSRWTPREMCTWRAPRIPAISRC